MCSPSHPTRFVTCVLVCTHSTWFCNKYQQLIFSISSMSIFLSIKAHIVSRVNIFKHYSHVLICFITLIHGKSNKSHRHVQIRWRAVWIDYTAAAMLSSGDVPNRSFSIFVPLWPINKKNWNNFGAVICPIQSLSIIFDTL